MKIKITIGVLLLIITSIINKSYQINSTSDFIIQILNDIVFLNKTKVNLNSDCSNQLRKLLIDLSSRNQDSLTSLSYFFLFLLLIHFIFKIKRVNYE